MKKRIKNVMLSTVLITSAVPVTTILSSPTAVEASTVSYNDLDRNQYWADDMQWMIDAGYITGYINQAHPQTGEWGNWLNPGGNLTESQMLSVLLRYNLGIPGYAQMQKDIPNPKNNWTYNHYVKAQEIGMVTLGSPSNSKGYANQQVTRGQLAQALVSMHYGKNVTLEQSVDFMFTNKITSGTNAANGPTVENFNPNDKLSRSHISAFLKRYHDAKESGEIKDAQISEQNNDQATFVQQVIDLTNEQRKLNGLVPLQVDENLNSVAQVKSEDMQQQNYFNHNSPIYGSPFEMMKTFDITYRFAGENIAIGYRTPEAVVDGWMNSPGHRANILNESFTHIGVGFDSGGYQWTQMFIGK